MADQSKFGKSAVISFCPFEHLYAIVTDKMPTKPFLDAIERYGIRLICPGHEGGQKILFSLCDILLRTKYRGETQILLIRS